MFNYIYICRFLRSSATHSMLLIDKCVPKWRISQAKELVKFMAAAATEVVRNDRRVEEHVLWNILIRQLVSLLRKEFHSPETGEPLL